jgi:transcriptional regulator with GAF, ATPase, and Fis domain
MSSENPITRILNDNDDIAVAAPLPDCFDETNTATMETFLEIMQHLTQQCTSQLLKNTNQNLQQALTLALEETQEQRKVAARQNHSKDDSSKIKNTAVALLKTAPDEQDNNDTTTFASLGKEWHSLYQAALASGTVFVDSIFPPTSASLYERRPSQTTTPTETVRCPCGLTAKSRTVQ